MGRRLGGTNRGIRYGVNFGNNGRLALSEETMRGDLRLQLFACALLASVLSAQPPVTMSQYDSARTGANTRETVLTPDNVNPASFGKLFAFSVDGAIFAQPLYLPSIAIPGKGVRDVVFAATGHDSVYAFDARVETSVPLWHVSFINPDAGITTVPARDVACPFIYPEVGITSTPVIDYSTGTLYVLARTKVHKGMFHDDEYVQELHALAITTGAEKFGGPVIISGKFQGRSGTVSFDSLRENPRAALLLANGRIYLTWASSCDVGQYYGWVMAYDARTLKQVGIFNTSPDAAYGGIWLSDTGPAADADGNVFVATGNGRFNAAQGGRDYGDSILKLRLDGRGLVPADYFTPFNQQELNDRDDDLGSGGPVLLPDQPGLHKRLLLAGGKGGVLYVIDRDRMGGYRVGADSHAVQTLLFSGMSLFGAPAYWNGHVYTIAANDVLRDFALRSGRLVQSIAGGLPKYPDGGATPAVSSNGARNGIVWAIATHTWRRGGPPAVLHAYEARNVQNELYSSERNSARDRAGQALRFTIPTVAKGRVYVGTRRELDVYGLLPGRKIAGVSESRPSPRP